MFLQTRIFFSGSRKVFDQKKNPSLQNHLLRFSRKGCRLNVSMYSLFIDSKSETMVAWRFYLSKGSAGMYLQLPLRQRGAGNVYRLVLSSWKVNIAKKPIAAMDHLFCNHFSRKVEKRGSRKVVQQTQIFFSGQPLFSNQISRTRFLVPYFLN